MNELDRELNEILGLVWNEGATLAGGAYVKNDVLTIEIDEAIAQIKQTILKEVLEALPKKDEYISTSDIGQAETDGYNQALSDCKQKLTELLQDNLESRDK